MFFYCIAMPLYNSEHVYRPISHRKKSTNIGTVADVLYNIEIYIIII